VELIRFYTCEGDPAEVALRLVLKAGDQALQVCAPLAILQRLSALLWSQPGFLAHAGPGADAATLQRSRLRLSVEPPCEPTDLLLNIGLDLPVDVPVRRLFELVGSDQREAARGRYRAHVAAGRQPQTVAVRAT